MTPRSDRRGVASVLVAILTTIYYALVLWGDYAEPFLPEFFSQEVFKVGVVVAAVCLVLVDFGVFQGAWKRLLVRLARHVDTWLGAWSADPKTLRALSERFQGTILDPLRQRILSLAEEIEEDRKHTRDDAIEYSKRILIPTERDGPDSVDPDPLLVSSVQQLSMEREAKARLDADLAPLRAGIDALEDATAELSEPQYSSLAEPFGALMTEWAVLVTREETPKDRKLAAVTLKEYVTQLGQVGKRWRPPQPFLPAHFEMYANCVSALFTTLRREEPESIIRVSTVFTHPLPKWYNYATLAGDEDDSAVAVFTREPWNAYLRAVRALCMKSGGEDHKVQMRRIIVGSNRYDYGRDQAGEELLIQIWGKDDERPRRMQSGKAAVATPGCLDLIDGVSAADGLEDQKLEFSSIASHRGKLKECPVQHDDWQKLRIHFEGFYHDDVHHRGNQVDSFSPGVFCTYVPDKGKLRESLKDVFIVQIEPEEGPMFGIAWRENERKWGGVGMVFLEDKDIRKIALHLDELWERGGKG